MKKTSKKNLKVVKESLDDEALDIVTAELEDGYTPAEKFIEAMILVRNKVDPDDLDFDKLGEDLGLPKIKVRAIKKICMAEELTFDELGAMILGKSGKPMTDMGAHALWKKAVDKLRNGCKKKGINLQDVLKIW